MAERENLESMNFGIENTTEMGDTQLLDTLFSSESVSENPDDIVKADEKPTEQKIEKKPKEEKPKEEKPSSESLISSFLEDNEEEEEEVVTNKKPVEEKPKDEVEEEFNQYAALSTDLTKLGVFSEEEEEEPITTPEQFLEKFRKENMKQANTILDNFIGRLGEDYQKAFDAIFYKGVNPKEYFGTYNTIVNFAELDLSKEENQERVVRQSLADQEWEQEDIDSEIDRLKNYQDLENVAKKHQRTLVKKEAQKLEQLEKQSQSKLQQREAQRQEYVSNVQNILQEKLKTKDFDGIPINPNTVNELQDFLLVDKWQTPSGEKLTDFDKEVLELKKPENHTMKVKVALLLQLLKKDPTLSTIQKTGISKKSDALFNNLARQTSKAQKPTSQPNRWFTD